MRDASLGNAICQAVQPTNTYLGVWFGLRQTTLNLGCPYASFYTLVWLRRRADLARTSSYRIPNELEVKQGYPKMNGFCLGR